LIAFINEIANASYTTINQCFNYFAGQSDKMVVQRDYEGIVTDGLVLNLDAGYLPSYPQNGTSWYDLGPSGNTGTLTNGPTFSSTNGGSIVFDGVDDYATGSLQDSSQYTLGIWINVITYTVGGGLLGGGNSQIYLQLGGGSTWQFFNAFNPSVGPTLGQWTYIVGVKGATQDSLYRNASLLNSASTSGISLGTSYIIAQRRVASISTNCRVGIAHIYNRALSSTEITQNYNATKSRFRL